MPRLLLTLVLLTAPTLFGCGEDLDPRAHGVWKVDVAAVANDAARGLSPAARDALTRQPNALLEQLAFEFGARTFTFRSAQGVQRGKFKVEKRDGDTSVLLAATDPPQRMQVTVVPGGLRLTFAERTLPLIAAPRTVTEEPKP